MGVMSCSRRGCNNVMCDSYNPKYGYLCGDCFEELVRLGVKTDIKEFMQSEKSGDEEEAARAYFDKIFERE